MAYTTQSDLEIAAGGADDLDELADDPQVIVQAQREADSWIDGYARRLHDVPFGATPDVTPRLVRALAAAEAIYRLRQWKRVVGDDDRERRLERERDMASLEAGKLNPVDADPYPISTGGGTPVVVERTGTESAAFGDFGRESLKGFW